MANPDHLTILRRGTDVWNSWRRWDRFRVPDSVPDGIKARLCGANPTGANLTNANLNNVER